ncbi:MAG: hypothetical protein DRN15_00065 [Thermoprotei archaeon]|nr:MAG: hypothetical protein DRM97_05985 [Thermoprotei archaeon]RLF25090.1 MAG: hypothetical protein DRN15_00065 [Thermoprotei archaeon]
MKLLILKYMDRSHPHAGGAEYYIHEVSERLVKYGYKIAIHSSEFPSCRRVEKTKGIVIIRRGRGLLTYLYAAIDYLSSLCREFDVVIDEYTKMFFLAPLYSRGYTVFMVHQLAKEVFPYEAPYLPYRVASLEDYILKKVYSKIPTIAASRSTALELKRLGFRQVYVAEPGINKELLYKKRSPYVSNVIVYLGRLVRYKRIEDAIKVLYIVRKRISNVRLYVMGRLCDLKYLSFLKHLARRLGLSSHVKFLLNVSEKEKVEVLRRAMLMIIPSVKEGWCISVIEANALGIPVVAYDVPGLRDSIVNGVTGITVPFAQVSLMADAVTKLLTDTEVYEQMSINCKEWASNFTWDRTAEKFRKAIEDILGS